MTAHPCETLSRDMARTRYTPEQKTAALVLYAEVGAAETARRTGVPSGTLQSWAQRNGVRSVATERTRAAVERHAVDLNARRLLLAAKLMDDIERLRRQLWSPTVERKPLVVSGGAHGGSHVEIVDVALDQPTFGDQKAIMTTLAIAVDKVQILTGEATERIEHRHVDAFDEELQRLTAELEHQAAS